MRSDSTTASQSDERDLPRRPALCIPALLLSAHAKHGGARIHPSTTGRVFGLCAKVFVGVWKNDVKNVMVEERRAPKVLSMSFAAEQCFIGKQAYVTALAI